MHLVPVTDDVGFAPATVRKDLARLVEHGIVPYWLIQVGRPRLFRLNCVLQAVQARADGDENAALAEALTEVLKKAIDRLGSEQSQIVTTIVLGYDDRFPLDKTTLEERRTAAGQLFRRGSKQVTYGTIRKYHERNALDQLTAVIVDLERNAGGSSPLTS